MLEQSQLAGPSLCQQCHRRPKVAGERYCVHCRFMVLRRLQKDHPAENEKVRTISRQWTEHIGRKALGVRMLAGSPDGWPTGRNA